MHNQQQTQTCTIDDSMIYYSIVKTTQLWDLMNSFENPS